MARLFTHFQILSELLEWQYSNDIGTLGLLYWFEFLVIWVVKHLQFHINHAKLPLLQTYFQWHAMGCTKSEWSDFVGRDNQRNLIWYWMRDCFSKFSYWPRIRNSKNKGRSNWAEIWGIFSLWMATRRGCDNTLNKQLIRRYIAID